MAKSMTVASMALTSFVLLCGPALAQGAQQTVEVPGIPAVKPVPAIEAVDAVPAVEAVPAIEAVAAVAAHQAPAGYRASKVIGSDVLNSDGAPIGEIDDIIVSSDGNEPYAVISIGGFLGMGTHLILVPYDSLELIDNKVVLASGTKEGLEAMPEFTYAAE
jgi:sporulation protein YlmC with PRC-barrel domain